MRARISKFHESKLNERGLHSLSVGEALRPRLMRKNTTIPGVADIFTLKLRDFYAVAAGTAVTAQTLFTIPVGQQYTPAGGTAFTKQRWHTNLTQPGQLAAPRRFLIKGMTAQYNGNIALTDANQMGFNTLASLYIDEKRYWESTLQSLPGGGGNFAGGAVFQTTAANASYATVANGYPTAGAALFFEGDGIWISLLQNFSVVLDPTQVQAGAFTTAASGGTTFGQGVNIAFALEGLLSGPVM